MTWRVWPGGTLIVLTALVVFCVLIAFIVFTMLEAFPPNQSRHSRILTKPNIDTIPFCDCLDCLDFRV